MHLDFDEVIPITVEDIYGYAHTPQAWPEVWGAFSKVTGPKDGWYKVWMRRTPFPLIVKITNIEPLQRVSWDLKGFWSGDGELRFETTEGGTRITGHETITLPLVVRPFDRLLAPRFAAVWDSGWRRLRRHSTNHS